MKIHTRRHDIDWLRVIAIWLLIVYHLMIGFQPFGVFIGFIQNNDKWTALQVPMSLLSIWRIPLLFFVSGMGVSFAIRKRNWSALIKERARRILLPLVFGALAIVPLHMFLWQDYYMQDLVYAPHPGHLWFLGNIFVYVLVLSPVFLFLKRKKDQPGGQRLISLFRHPLVFVILMVPFVLEAMIVQPEYFEMYAYTWHGFWLGLIAFFFGFLMVYVGDVFWQQLKRFKWLLLALAGAMFAVRWGYFDLSSPPGLKAVESNLFVFTVLGFGYQYLNKPSEWLSYLSSASYPIYILHMLFLYVGSYWMFPLSWSPAVKFTAICLLTFIGCYVVYEFIIRRTSVLRPLFGLRRVQEVKVTTLLSNEVTEEHGQETISKTEAK